MKISDNLLTKAADRVRNRNTVLPYSKMDSLAIFVDLVGLPE
jgi:hypothetical protein